MLVKVLQWSKPIIPLLLGFYLLLSGLMALPLWEDEGWTIAASANPSTVIKDWAITDVHPPLYFMALSVWRMVTGDSIFMMRMFSVLVAFVGVALIVRVGTDLFNRRAGLISGLLYALHDQVIVLSQEIRHYAGQLTLTVAVLWLYWRWQKSGKFADGLAFAIVGIIALYTHYWIAFSLLACGVHLLIVSWRDWRQFFKIALPFVAIGAGFALWIPALISQITLERPEGLPHALENSNLVYRVLLYQLVGIPEALWLVLIIAGAIGLWTLKPQDWMPKSPSLLLLLALIIPPAMTLAVNGFYPILSFRALAVIIAPVVLLSAYGLSRFRKPELIVMMAFIIIMSLTSRSAEPVLRIDWARFADTLSQHSTDNDVILLENYLGGHTLAYYFDHSPRATDYAQTQHIRSFYRDEYAPLLEETLRDHDGLWIPKFGWVDTTYDIRPYLREQGFIETLPEVIQDRSRPYLLWRFDRLPDHPPIVNFGDYLGLYRADIALNDDVVTANFLWGVDGIINQDYTVSVLLLGATMNHSQDTRPMDTLDNSAFTSTWEAGNFYFDSHTMNIEGVASGVYQVAVQVYAFTDETYSETVSAPVSDCRDDAECRFIVIGSVTIP